MRWHDGTNDIYTMGHDRFSNSIVGCTSVGRERGDVSVFTCGLDIIFFKSCGCVVRETEGVTDDIADLAVCIRWIDRMCFFMERYPDLFARDRVVYPIAATDITAIGVDRVVCRTIPSRKISTNAKTYHRTKYQ